MMQKIMKSAGTPVRSTGVEAMQKKDLRRLKNAKRASDKKEKKKRVVAQQLKAAREEAFREAEGVTYSSGTF